MPAGKTQQAPVIVAGMHRSGTTLVARVLRELGVFLGWRTEENGESRTFLEINKWLLLQAGGAWDFPPPPSRFADPAARDLCVRFMKYALNSVWFSFYRGRPHLRPNGSPPRFPYPWGWKDPRNTVTLSLWHVLYPDARVVYVTRHGVDVAASLKRRHSRRMASLAADFDRRRHGFWLRLRKRRLETFPGDLPDALDLWRSYQEIAAQSAELFADRFHHLRFESLLTSPESELERVGGALGLDVPQAALDRAKALIDPRRAFAFRADPVLAALAEENADLLARFGYGSH